MTDPLRPVLASLVLLLTSCGVEGSAGLPGVTIGTETRELELECDTGQRGGLIFDEFSGGAQGYPTPREAVLAVARGQWLGRLDEIRGSDDRWYFLFKGKVVAKVHVTDLSDEYDGQGYAVSGDLTCG